MSHPCDGHACDHCYLCDVVGVCCATVPHAASAAAGCAHDHAFHARVIAEVDRQSGLAQLMQLDSARQLSPASLRLALPAGQPLAGEQLLLSTTPDLEADHVFAPRRHQP